MLKKTLFPKRTNYWLLIIFWQYSTCCIKVKDIAEFRAWHQSTINDQDAKGRTALHLACKVQDLVAVQELLKKGAKTTIADRHGNTPLHIACNISPGSTTTLHIIKELIAANAPINALNAWGHTPLHLAASCQKYTGIPDLIAHGALLNKEDYAGATPLDHAVILGTQTNNVYMLLNAGAAITGQPLGFENYTTHSWPYFKEACCTIFHFEHYHQDPSLLALIRHPRTMTQQDKQIAQTVLLINRFRKDSLLACIPKDVLVRCILPHCVTNFYYVFGTLRQRVAWHLEELERFFRKKNNGGFIPCECQDEENVLLIPDKIIQQHKNKILRNYKAADLRKLSRMTFKLGHDTLTSRT